MKHIKEIREKCYLCNGLKHITIVNKDKNLSLTDRYHKRRCPLCEGKGYLALVKTEIRENNGK